MYVCIYIYIYIYMLYMYIYMFIYVNTLSHDSHWLRRVECLRGRTEGCDLEGGDKRRCNFETIHRRRHNTTCIPCTFAARVQARNTLTQERVTIPWHPHCTRSSRFDSMQQGLIRQETWQTAVELAEGLGYCVCDRGGVEVVETGGRDAEAVAWWGEVGPVYWRHALCICKCIYTYI